MDVHRRDSERIQQALYEGAGAVSYETFFESRSRLPSRLMRYYLAPGTSEGLHVHDADVPTSCTPDDADELYVVISGELVMTIEGERVTLSAGDAAYAAAGTEHGIANESEQPAELILMWGPPGPAAGSPDAAPVIS